MLDLLLHTSPEPIFIYDIEDLKFLEVNPAALRIYGYSQEEFLQMDLTDLYAPDDIQTLLDSSNAKNKEKVFTGPWKHKKKDGTSILVEISKLSFIYRGKKAHFNIVRDVTEKIKLLKESRLFQAAFNDIDDLIIVTDAEGFIQQINNAVLKALDIPEKELLNMPFLTLLPDDERANTNSNIFISKNKNTTKSVSEIKKNDGTFEKGEIIYTPIFDFNEQLIAYNILIKLEKQNKDASALNGLGNNRNLENSSKQKDSTVDFSLLSCMFHEILTPMNVILGFLQEICDSIEDQTAEQKEAIDIIDQNRSILLQTMNEILEYSQLETNDIEVTPKDVAFTEVLDTVQENTKKIANKLHVEFSYGKISSSLVIETDLHKLETLVSLLVSISMRLTKEKAVFISATQSDDLNCVISIRDSSGNITPNLLNTLTDIFSSKKEDISIDYGVSRVTVGLAKKILEILSGKVEVVKKGDELSEFGFLLPLKYVPAEIKEDRENKQQSVPEIKKEAAEYHANRVSQPIPPKPVYETPPVIVQERIPTQAQMPQPVARVIQTEQKAPAPAASKLPGKIDFSVMKCLYIEDQVDAQTLFRVQLKDIKEIDFALNFDFALPLLRQKRYDFVVIDINLQSHYNGIDVLKLIRSLPGYDRTPIIAVTAYLLPGDKEKFIASGFNGFVAKPILRNKLFDILERIIYMS